jgi:hypothetical protein
MDLSSPFAAGLRAAAGLVGHGLKTACITKARLPSWTISPCFFGLQGKY